VSFATFVVKILSSKEVSMNIQSINPATGEVLENFEEMSTSEIDGILEAAETTFREWRKRPFADRTKRMREAARILRDRKEKYARTMSLEMGKPIVQGEAEAEKCAWACDYYAEHAEAFLAEQPRETDASRSYIRFEPLGPVLAIMPWNFPFWQVFRFAAPALMAGNAGILKHASNVPRCALQIEEIFREAGFPENLFRTVLVGSGKVAGIIADPRIRAATLTGSESAGSKVAEQAGREIKKTVLELGGSDPFIVLEDADVQKAAKTAADARLINSGESCIAAKRFIVVEKVSGAFLETFVSEMRSRKMGDPLNRQTQVGPQARDDLRASLHHQVDESVKRGAKLLLGGRIPEGRGAFYPPTVLDGVQRGMPAFDEETFGPVAAVIRAQDEADAIRLANDSPFGLGASLWTHDRQRAERVVGEIEAGCVFVNELVKSDPRLPFGGVKRSGYGRELSEYGIREFVNIKSVWMA
jgi:succinate-semialdehyde dehydrogenase / glutarate-semialdehyde dehydrogenase